MCWDHCRTILVWIADYYYYTRGEEKVRKSWRRREEGLHSGWCLGNTHTHGICNDCSANYFQCCCNGCVRKGKHTRKPNSTSSTNQNRFCKYRRLTLLLKNQTSLKSFPWRKWEHSFLCTELETHRATCSWHYNSTTGTPRTFWPAHVTSVRSVTQLSRANCNCCGRGLCSDEK